VINVQSELGFVPVGTVLRNEQDVAQIKPEKYAAECAKRYPNTNVCFISLTKTGKGDYRVQCGEKRSYTKDPKTPGLME
jgi:hypothetical protein